MDAPDRPFPMLYQGRNEQPLRAKLPSVPWSFVAPYEMRALRNHSQTLKRLADRGGLGPEELMALIEDKKWPTMSAAAAVERVLCLLAEVKKP